MRTAETWPGCPTVPSAVNPGLFARTPMRRKVSFPPSQSLAAPSLADLAFGMLLPRIWQQGLQGTPF